MQPSQEIPRPSKQMSRVEVPRQGEATTVPDGSDTTVASNITETETTTTTILVQDLMGTGTKPTSRVVPPT
jgi:hypothetical protein